MKFEFTLSKEYLLDFHMKYYFKTKTFLEFKIALTVSLLFLLTILYFIVETKYKIVVIIIFFIYLTSSIIFEKQLSKIQILNFLDNYKNKFLFLPTIITMDDNIISIDTKFNIKLIEWSIIKDLYIVENNIIIRVLENKNIIFIPFECFKNNNDLDVLIDLFRKNSFLYPQYMYPTDIEI